MPNNNTTSNAPSLKLNQKGGNSLFGALLWLMAAIASTGIGYYFFDGERKELTFMTSDECSTHDLYSQICKTDKGSLYLRRVEIDNNRMSVSKIIDNPEWESFRYLYMGFWFEDCDSGFTIESDSTFSSGDSMVLECISESNMYLKKDTPPRLELAYIMESKSGMEFDYSGFKINHNYSGTDYSPLLRQYSLTNSGILQKREARLKKEAKTREDKENQRIACLQRNVKNKAAYDAGFQEASEKIMSSVTPLLTYSCVFFSTYSDACLTYDFTIENSTKYKIKSLDMGYENKKTCPPKPDGILSFHDIEPLERQTVQRAHLKSGFEDFCTIVKSVELVYTAFIGESCL